MLGETRSGKMSLAESSPSGPPDPPPPPRSRRELRPVCLPSSSSIAIGDDAVPCPRAGNSRLVSLVRLGCDWGGALSDQG